MGERRRERTSKRRRTVVRSGQKSCSDSEVAQSRLKDRRAKSRDQLPWPRAIEAISVDELARYRRRRVPNSPKDTLGEQHREERDNVYGNLVTEYRRSFRATSEESLLRQHDFRNDDEVINASVAPISLLESTAVDGVEDQIPDAKSMMTNVEELSRVPPDVPRHSSITKRIGAKRAGEIYGDTEYSNYKSYEGYHKPQLTRRPTSLKMEGDMRGVTEQCEKFIEWFNVSRPEPARIPTNLKLEGHLQTTTENHDQYVPFVGARRPEILRQSAQLKLEGESNFNPEYTDVFRPRAFQEKRLSKLPKSHLKTGGEFISRTENAQHFIDPRGAVPINHDRNSIGDDDMSKEEDKQRHKEKHMQILVSKLEDLQAPPLETPEYKDAFKDFPRERSKSLKPEDEIGRSDGSKVHLSSNHRKFSTKIDQDPEYKSKYLDKDRSLYKKPVTSSRRPSVSSLTYGRQIVPDLRQYNATSEVRSQYIPYGHIPRVESLRKPVTLRPEGNMNLQPEYRDAYCGRRDSTISNSNDKHSDRSISASRRRDNNWINNDNGEQFGMINAEHDQDAFQVLQTRVHNENIIGKPPLAIRRGSRSLQPQRPTHLDIANPAVLKNRSPSPTYRLHVCNVDDEPRGFTHQRRRSSSLHYKTSQSPSPDREIHHDDNQRAYSPSFGRESLLKHRDDKDQAFVVLNNDTDNNPRSIDNRTRRFDRNANIETIGIEGRGRAKNKKPTNWMPPWYDSTNTM
ncbi:hypothetical protein PV325_001142 [Microctonus aethiopoides]|nr:hypothetical protein PV325_001142 [Microctonus aethiopoides]